MGEPEQHLLISDVSAWIEKPNTSAKAIECLAAEFPAVKWVLDHCFEAPALFALARESRHKFDTSGWPTCVEFEDRGVGFLYINLRGRTRSQVIDHANLRVNLDRWSADCLGAPPAIQINADDLKAQVYCSEYWFHIADGSIIKLNCAPHIWKNGELQEGGNLAAEIGRLSGAGLWYAIRAELGATVDDSSGAPRLRSGLHLTILKPPKTGGWIP